MNCLALMNKTKTTLFVWNQRNSKDKADLRNTTDQIDEPELRVEYRWSENRRLSMTTGFHASIFYLND